MPFNETQIMQAIEHGLRRTNTADAIRVSHIALEDVWFWGLSTDTFVRCDATVLIDGEEQQIKLIIKRWAPGGPTDVDMGVVSLPREALAVAAGLFDPDSMPSKIDAPYVTALVDPESGDHWVIMRDVSDELAGFRSPADLAELHRRYAVALDRLALMHATWEKPNYQARLRSLNWLVPDSTRLSRGQAVARYIEGLPLSESKVAQVESVSDWVKGARIQAAREAFYETLPTSDAVLWKRHECDRSALIAAFAEFPTTLVHGDFYPFNIGLRDDGGEQTMVLIDWAWIGNGCAALDVAKLLCVGAAQQYADFDAQGLATHYFERYLAHGGMLYDLPTWERAYELAEVYHALIVHSLATGWAILDDAPSRVILEARTARLTEMIAKNVA